MKLLGPEETTKALRDKAANELDLAKKLGTIIAGCPELLGPIASASASAKTKLEAWKTKQGSLPDEVQATLDRLAAAEPGLASAVETIALFASVFAGLTPEQLQSATPSILEDGWARSRAAFESPWKSGPTGTTKHEIGTTMRTLELLFGLPAGADVSGKIADTIFALEWLLDHDPQSSGYPAPCLLAPLASEVASGRATILEIALTQTMNAYSTYAVGCYSSLYPVDDGEPRNPPAGFDKQRLESAKQDIHSALESAELGRLMLLAFETRDASRHALVCESEAERQQFRRFALLTPTRYNYFAVPRTLVAALRDQARYTSGAIKQIVADMSRGPDAWQEELDVLEAL